MSTADDRRFREQFGLTIGIFFGVIVGIVFFALYLADQPAVTDTLAGTRHLYPLYLSIIAMFGFLALWTVAWRRRPILALGIFIGAAAVLVATALGGPSRPHHMPVWLPPLPFAIAATLLFYFGTAAWLWSRRR